MKGQENSPAQSEWEVDDGGMSAEEKQRSSPPPSHFSFDFKTVAQ